MFLVGSGEPPPKQLLDRVRLSSYAYARLEAAHPARESLLPAFLTATTAHETAKAAVTPLIRAWRDAGIDALAFKGFALALTAYDHPGQRFYEDLDVLIRPGDAAMAERLARDLGWSVRWSAARAGNAYAHEVLHLLSADGRLMLDVHRLILHSYAPWQRRLRQLSEAAWAASDEAPLGDTTLRVLDPRDAILMGLVLNRAWSTDAWRLKPRDYVDFRVVVERHGVTKAALVERARELRCERTLARFLERCDPFERRIDLRTPSRAQRLRWSLAVARERRPYWFDHALNLPLIAPGVLRDTLLELPGLLRVLRLLRAEADVTHLLAHLDAPPNAPDARAANTASPLRPLAERRRYRVVRGVRWGLKLLRVRPEGDCLPRSLAVFARLRQLGAPAVFVSGVRRSDAGLHGHAWVELDGEMLPELSEPLGVRYEPNLRYPAGEAEVSSSAAPTPGPQR